MQGLLCREFVDDSLPLDCRFLEVPEEAQRHAGGSQIIDALSHPLFGQVVRAFEFDDELAFHKISAKYSPS